MKQPFQKNILRALPGFGILTVLALPIAVFAEKCGEVDLSVAVGCTGNQNPIYGYLAAIIRFGAGLIGLGMVISIIVAGYQYMTSEGNPGQIEKAKNRLLNTAIALILFILMTAILRYLVPGVFL